MRYLVLALLAAQAHEINLSDKPELAAALGRLHVAAELELAVRGLDGVEVPAPVPVTFAMVFAMAVFADWLFPPGGQPSRDEIVREITHCLREGIIQSLAWLTRPPSTAHADAPGTAAGRIGSGRCRKSKVRSTSRPRSAASSNE